MKLYAGTTEQFRTDARMHRIAEKLRAEYTTQIGHRPSPNEVASWQNSSPKFHRLAAERQAAHWVFNAEVTAPNERDSSGVVISYSPMSRRS